MCAATAPHKERALCDQARVDASRRITTAHVALAGCIGCRVMCSSDYGPLTMRRGVRWAPAELRQRITKMFETT